MKKTKYTEPVDYIPKEIRKELGLGEFAKEEADGERERDRENKELREVFIGKKQ